MKTFVLSVLCELCVKTPIHGVGKDPTTRRLYQKLNDFRLCLDKGGTTSVSSVPRSRPHGGGPSQSLNSKRRWYYCLLREGGNIQKCRVDHSPLSHKDTKFSACFLTANIPTARRTTERPFTVLANCALKLRSGSDTLNPNAEVGVRFSGGKRR